MTSCQPDPGVVRWRLRLASPPQRVWEILASEAGRAGFWAESAAEKDGSIEFVFPNGMRTRSTILEAARPRVFAIEYFGSPTTFRLAPIEGDAGTDLLLEARDVPERDRLELTAGWVSVLMALKAFVDHGVDLRNHDAERTWDQGYADN